MRHAIGRRMLRLGLRLMGLPPEQFVGFHHPAWADPAAQARFAAAAWWLPEAPLETVVCSAIERDGTVGGLIRTQQAAGGPPGYCPRCMKWCPTCQPSAPE